MLTLEELLQPIGGAAESGQNLRYDPLFDRIREALTEEDDTLPMGNWARQTKRADYPLAASLAQEALQKRSKDLWLAVWLNQAMLRTEGYDALEPSLRLLTGLQRQFWNSLYPEIEEGDSSLRAAPVQWGLRQYAMSLQGFPITGDGIPYAAFKTIRAGVPWPSRGDGDDGTVTAESLDAALKSTAAEFYANAGSKLAGALDALEELRLFCDAHYGEDGPSFSDARSALENLRAIVTQQLRTRPQTKAKVSGRTKPEAQTAPAPQEREEVKARVAAAEDPGGAPASSVSAPAGEMNISGAPASWEEAMGRVETCATYLLEQRPEHPACYLLAMALQYGRDGFDSPGVPSTEARLALKQATEGEDWENMLTQALRAMLDVKLARWLDVHYYLWQAAENLGAAQLQALVWSVIKARLAEDSTWPGESFGDDTPVASADTQGWLQREAASLTASSGAGTESATAGPAEPDGAVARARELASQGEAGLAVGLLMESASIAPSGRDRFLLRMEVSRVCMEADQRELAAHMLRHMLTEADDLRLEQWEGRGLFGTLLAMLLKAIDGYEADEEERPKLFARLCRVDPARAFAMQAAE